LTVDFALILFIALVISGTIWLWDKAVGVRRRLSRGAAGDVIAGGNVSAGEGTDYRPSLVVEYAKAFFPVILLVFLLRSFVIEPFRIPSGSMLPSLNIGDFILVDKFSYGVRLPVINEKVVDTGLPERGEVMVFRYPHDTSINFIKRVVGIPGDAIRYEDKQIFVNDQPVPIRPVGEYELVQSPSRSTTVLKLEEDLGDDVHGVLHDPDRRSRAMQVTVPDGQYFVMGDNRDHSNDSRFWGFVPEENIVGRAFFIWFSWDSANGGGVNWSRIGNTIH
jgi:signal peptidase I